MRADAQFPIRFLDGIRFTFTNLEDNRDLFIQDTWMPEASLPEYTRILSGEWTGNNVIAFPSPRSTHGIQVVYG